VSNAVAPTERRLLRIKLVHTIVWAFFASCIVAIPGGTIRLQANLSRGVLGFAIPTPSANSTRLNFTGEAGLGLRFLIPDGRVAVGYRLHHLSNAGRGEVNPGVDSHLLVLGFWLDRAQTRRDPR